MLYEDTYERVAEHGEVFTNETKIKAMCDLVEQSIYFGLES